jgi:hypothetical protein
VLVRFRDDLALAHHRWVVEIADDGDLWVAIPDRDVWNVNPSDPRFTEFRRWNGERLPFGMRKKSCYLDRDTDIGRFNKGEFNILRGKTRRPEVRHRLRAKTPPSCPSAGRQLVATTFASAAAAAELDSLSEAGVIEDEVTHVWAVYSPASDEVIGSAVPLGSISNPAALSGSDYAVFRDRHGNFGIVIKVIPDDTVAFITRRVDQWKRSCGTPIADITPRAEEVAPLGDVAPIADKDIELAVVAGGCAQRSVQFRRTMESLLRGELLDIGALKA